MELTLTTPVRFVPRVGPMMAERLDRLGITTIRDFLYHIPFRYDDFTLVSPIGNVQPGEKVTVKGTVERFANFATKTGKRMQEATVSDDSGRLSIVWFNQPYLRSVITPGTTYHFSGTVGFFGHKLVLTSPVYEPVEEEGGSSLHTGRLVPIYPETEGISSKWMRGRIAFLLDQTLPQIREYLPEQTITQHHLMGIQDALRSIHFPPSFDQAANARKRLGFDELLILELRAFEQKRERETQEAAYPVSVDVGDIQSFIMALPYTLTGDQQKSISAILGDLSRPFPMNRLLVGDVGSGKTVVAATAMYATFRKGLTSVLMAPTQILAEQHYETISYIFSPLSIPVYLVTAQTKTLPQEEKGKPAVFVGTHALLSESMKFKSLGLVVIDEQHRFGVTQRSQLIEKKGKKKTPHLLTMTATPIPRTVAKTIMGNMDLSTLDEMPKGRKQIKTWVVPKEKRTSAYAWMEKELTATGGRAFIICPLIDVSETLTTVKAVNEEYKTIQKTFPARRVGLLHGRMKADEKTRALDDFREGKTTILVSTPVVEVGIDIPEASIIVIEAAERFGLGQLHQLRGRVGRGSISSYCLLFTEIEEEAVLTRLKALEAVFSGPKLAEIDLNLRGPGDVLGTRQHGIPNLTIASFTDTALIEQTQQAVMDLTREDPLLLSFPLLREQIKHDTIEAITKD